MTIALDANMLILLFDANVAPPTDPATGQAITHCQQRISHFLNTYGRPRGATIIVPTPSLAEFLVKVDPRKKADYISQAQRIRGCRISSFDTRASIEFSDLQRSMLNERRRGSKPNNDESRAKAKFDQQIVAIAKVEGVQTIYSNDDGLGRYAARAGIRRIGVAELPLPPEDRQGVLALEPPEVDTADGGEDEGLG